jgi:hypothetical protein
MAKEPRFRITAACSASSLISFMAVTDISLANS